MRRRTKAVLAAATALPLLAACNPMVPTAGSAVAAPAPAPAPAPVPGVEVYPRPADGVFRMVGHGWGHAHGMSQWGAQGAATLGIPSSTILSTYYPGTASTRLPDSPIRVKLTRDEGSDLQVLPSAGLTVTDAANRQLLLPAGAPKWRLLNTSGGVQLQRLDDNQWTWTTVPVAGATTLASPVRFTNTANMISVVFPDGWSRDYRGNVSGVRASSGAFVSVVTLGMEDYLRGVVPIEMSPSWKPAALEAQAVAARTYAAQRRVANLYGGLYDICDSVMCQVFNGTRLRSPAGATQPVEYASTDAAIRATAELIRTYNGKPAFTEFSASNGGWSLAGSAPYLVAKADPWDGVANNPMHTWRANLPVSAIEARYPAVGRLLNLKITKRDGNGDWGGRPLSIVLEGVDSAGRPTSVNATPGGMYAARPFGTYSDGVRSTWFRIESSVATPQYKATLVGAAPTVSVPRAGSTTVTLRWRNDGMTTWTLDGRTLVGVRSASTPSAGADWFAPNRPGALKADVAGATTVAPGQTASITFRVYGNNLPAGTRAEVFEPLREMVSWFGGAVTVNVSRV